MTYCNSPSCSSPSDVGATCFLPNDVLPDPLFHCVLMEFRLSSEQLGRVPAKIAAAIAATPPVLIHHVFGFGVLGVGVLGAGVGDADI